VIRPWLHGRVEHVYKPMFDVDFAICCHDTYLTSRYTSYSGQIAVFWPCSGPKPTRRAGSTSCSCTSGRSLADPAPKPVATNHNVNPVGSKSKTPLAR
jgi:hypothetical protein